MPTSEQTVPAPIRVFNFEVSSLLLGRALDSIAEGGSTEVAVFVEEVLQTLNDLIEYFKQPDSELEHEEKQCLLRSIIKRQDLFKEEVSRRHRVSWWRDIAQCGAADGGFSPYTC